MEMQTTTRGPQFEPKTAASNIATANSKPVVGGGKGVGGGGRVVDGKTTGGDNW
jgi:hypothetical protein